MHRAVLPPRVATNQHPAHADAGIVDILHRQPRLRVTVVAASADPTPRCGHAANHSATRTCTNSMMRTFMPTSIIQPLANNSCTISSTNARAKRPLRFDPGEKKRFYYPRLVAIRNAAKRAMEALLGGCGLIDPIDFSEFLQQLRVAVVQTHDPAELRAVAPFVLDDLAPEFDLPKQ